ncbi:MAG: aminoacyl-tRNA hydrolase, partial [Lachnospiraceae bacterium]|nr:aminoacyl-tRNA hydrolase [Lachnospiraceae bacterium]
AHLGTQVFPRVKIGVGEKPEGWDLADHVLARFPAEVEPAMRDALARAAEATVCIMTEGVTAAQNIANRKE